MRPSAAAGAGPAGAARSQQPTTFLKFQKRLTWKPPGASTGPLLDQEIQLMPAQEFFGGTRYAMNETKVRIDYVHHALSAVYQYVVGARLDEAGFDLADEPACFDVLTASSWGFAEARAGDVCLVVPRADDRRAGVWRRPGERRATTTSQGRRRVDGAAAERSYDLDAVEQTRRRVDAIEQTRRETRTPQNAPVEGRPVQPVLEDHFPSS